MSSTSDGRQVLADLPLPSTERPAGADPVTGALLDIWSAQIRGTIRGLMSVGVLAVGLVLVWSWDIDPAVAWSFTGFWVVLLVLLVGPVIRSYVRYGRWWPAALGSLPVQAWREVPAAVVGEDLVEPRDGSLTSHIRITGLGEGSRQLIARAGRVWVVGPDPSGWLTVRLDGSPVFYPARLVRPRAGLPALAPRPAGTSGTAADDPVTSAAAATQARLVTWWFAVLALYALVAVPVAVLRSSDIPIGLMLTVLLLPWLVVVLLRRRFWALRRVPKLLRAGPWTRVEAALRPSETSPMGVTPVGFIHLDGGRSLELKLPTAGPDLLGTIRLANTLWVAGAPEPGRAVAVGYPGYPVVGFARLS